MNHLGGATVQVGRIEDVIHSSVKFDWAGLPFPGVRMAIELRERVGHALPFQPFDCSRVLSVVKVAHDKRGQSRFARRKESLNFSRTSLAREQIATDPTAALADRRMQMNIQNLHR